MSDMRKILLETQHIDKQSAVAAKRIATALDLGDLLQNTSTALSALTELTLYVHDLQRENLELHFQVENPNFDLEKELKSEKAYVKDFFLSSRSDAGLLIQKYSFEYFSDNYHPEFVLNLCEFLCASCTDNKVQPHPLWECLISTTGFITKEITGTFGIRESDQGVI
jgi:hypothetical protein